MEDESTPPIKRYEPGAIEPLRKRANHFTAPLFYLTFGLLTATGISHLASEDYSAKAHKSHLTANPQAEMRNLKDAKDFREKRDGFLKLTGLSAAATAVSYLFRRRS